MFDYWSQLIGLREKLQEKTIFHGNIYGFRLRFSLSRQPINGGYLPSDEDPTEILFDFRQRTGATAVAVLSLVQQSKRALWRYIPSGND